VLPHFFCDSNIQQAVKSLNFALCFTNLTTEVETLGFNSLLAILNLIEFQSIFRSDSI
jgi:hypothetical protein